LARWERPGRRAYSDTSQKVLSFLGKKTIDQKVKTPAKKFLSFLGKKTIEKDQQIEREKV